MGLDCLVAVTARYYTKGDKEDYDTIEGDFATFGTFDSDEEEEYINIKDIPEEKTEHNAHMVRYFGKEIEGNSEVLKDFIVFDMDTVGFGDFDYPYTCGVDSSVEDCGWYEEFQQYIDKLVERANMVKEECDKKRVSHDSKRGGTKVVKFVVAMNYWSHQSYEGEWDVSSSIAGFITRDDVAEMLKLKAEK